MEIVKIILRNYNLDLHWVETLNAHSSKKSNTLIFNYPAEKKNREMCEGIVTPVLKPPEGIEPSTC